MEQKTKGERKKQTRKKAEEHGLKTGMKPEDLKMKTPEDLKTEETQKTETGKGKKNDGNETISIYRSQRKCADSAVTGAVTFRRGAVAAFAEICRVCVRVRACIFVGRFKKEGRRAQEKKSGPAGVSQN